MTEPDERVPAAGTAGPASSTDPEAAEEYAESVPIDPTPDQVEHYRRMVGDSPADSPADSSADSSA